MNFHLSKLICLYIFITYIYVPNILSQCYIYSGARWPANTYNVTYHINSGLSSAFATHQDFENAIDSGAAQWNNAGALFQFNKGNDVNYDRGNEPYNINQVGFYIKDTDSSTAITVPWVYAGTDTLARVETYFNLNYIYSSNPNSDELDIWTTAAHEFGHWLDLYDETDPTCSANVMYKFLTDGDISRRHLTEDDKDGIISIYGSSLEGVNDYIWMTTDLDHFDVNYLYVGHLNVTLVDVDGDGSYLVNLDSLKIKASCACGDVLVDEVQGTDFEIPTLPNGYNWGRDANGYVIGSLSIGGTDNDGIHHTATMPIKIGNVPNTFITSGTLTSNTSWCGTITITGTITVPNGLTLTVNPGALINFASGSSLIVNGKLNATFCTFTSTGSTTPGSWGSITLNGSGANGSSISYADIKYGNQIDVINANNVTVQNCNITNSSGLGIEFSGGTGCSASYNTIANSNTTHGILVENGANVTVNDNVIYKTNQNHQGVGIDFGGGGTGTVWQNDVDYYGWGICAIWGSSPEFRTQNTNNTDKRNNRITNCYYGVMVYNNSYPIIGLPEPGNVWTTNSNYNNNVKFL